MAQKTIKVKSGDTLSKIAKAAGTTVSAIASANKIKDVNKIYSGQSLSIPTSSSSQGSSSKSSSISSGGSGMTTTQIKALQTSLNAKGANLKVDGIYGPLTAAASSKYGNSSKTAGMSKPSQNMTYASSLKPINVKQAITSVKNLASSSTPKKNLLGASAGDTLQATLLPNADINKYNSTTDYSNLDLLLSGGMSVPTFTKQAVSDIGNTVKTFGNNVRSALSSELQYSSADTGLIDESGNPIQAPETNDTPVDINTAITSNGLVDENGNPVPAPETTQTSLDTTSYNTPSPNVPNIIKDFNIKSSNLSSNPLYFKGNNGEFQSGDMITVSNNIANDLIKTYNGDLTMAYNYLNSPQGQADIKPFLDKGGKIEDITSKLSTAKNGIVGEQTYAQFEEGLKNYSAENQQAYQDYVNSKMVGITPGQINTNGLPSELKTIADAQNKELVMKSQYLNDYQKMLYESSYTDKMVAMEEIKQAEKLLTARETAIEAKLKLETKKLKAQMKAQEAEDEQDRINGMNYMQGYLAKLGALDTTSNAGLGLQQLENKYQQQKTANRQKYLFAIDELEANADEKLNDLRYNFEKDKLETYKDLNKSDRELRMDIFKLKSDYDMSVLEVNTKYAEKLSDYKIAQAKENKTLNNNWLNAYFTLSAGDMFSSLPAEFRSQWLSNNQISPEGFKTTQEDLSKDFSSWSKNKTSDSFVNLTPTQKTNAMKFLTENKAPQWVIDGVKSGDENAILTTLRLMEES